MSAYVIVQVNVTDAAKYEAYKSLAAAAVEKHGGRYIVRGGEAEDLEGTRPYSRLVVLEFETIEQAKRWYQSLDYQKAKSARAGAGVGVFTVVAGV
jgi:uncharacterized protein (DUF1330 family)